MNMQKVTSWARGNWLIIVSCLVLVAALIVGPMFGSRLSKSLTAKVTKDAEGSYNALARDTVPYTVPNPSQPGEPLVTATLTPHATNTARFQSLREREQRETVDVWTNGSISARASTPEGPTFSAMTVTSWPVPEPAMAAASAVTPPIGRMRGRTMAH